MVISPGSSPPSWRVYSMTAGSITKARGVIGRLILVDFVLFCTLPLFWTMGGSVGRGRSRGANYGVHLFFLCLQDLEATMIDTVMYSFWVGLVSAVFPLKHSRGPSFCHGRHLCMCVVFQCVLLHWASMFSKPPRGQEDASCP